MSAAHGQAKVLVVDDDPAMLRLVSILLRTDGFAVETALGGSAGLDQLGEARPDLVLLDLKMPGIDGREFYRRAMHEGFRGPVVFCSAFGAKEAQQELGAAAYITKPFDPAEVGATLRSVLREEEGEANVQPDSGQQIAADHR
jgi:DNA-binding response OmpR family regulator